VAGNAANGNGNNQGDQIYTSSLVVQEAGPNVSGTVFALPQLAFGGGWYTAMYFTNTTDAPAIMGVKFYGPNGAALSVPLVGVGPVSSQVITLAPKATTVMEAPNTGDLQQGWAEATLPTGVTGYGVFRQTVAGRPDQDLRMGDHPIAWIHCLGEGRSFYSAIGHRPESYSEPHYLKRTNDAEHGNRTLQKEDPLEHVGCSAGHHQ